MVYCITTLILIGTIAAFFLFVQARHAFFWLGAMAVAWRGIAAIAGFWGGPLYAHGHVREHYSACFPYRPQLVLLSGAMELAGAIGLLLPAFTRAASTCMAVLMIVIFPANVYVANQTVGGLHMPGIPARLAMQVVYIVLLLLAGRGLPNLRAVHRSDRAA